MTIRGVARVRGAVKRLTHGFVPTVLVLLYHRVIDLPADPHRLCVSPQRFAEHLEVLRRWGRPWQVRDLTAALRAGRLPRRGVVITFDDGYADNLHQAYRLLERHDVPATFFVTAGYVGGEREFWWDELERILLAPGELPATLALTLAGQRHEWNLGQAVVYGPEEQRRDRNWHVGHKTDPSERQRIYRSLYGLLGPVSDAARQEALGALRAWAGVAAAVRPTHRALDRPEVGRLASSGLVEVGAHTVTHPVLASLQRHGQWEEVRGSKTLLEEMIGRPVTSFAYPYGSRLRSDYTDETVAIVREAGFDGACSYLAKPVRRGAKPFELSRANVGDWDGDELTRRLRGWLDG
jgi:peptidoglycan/xylan/chitin deacetylase (PgdA/CDA1 family)